MPVSACVKTCGTLCPCEPVFYWACSHFYTSKGSTYTERGPDRWARRCIINYTLAFNASDPEILSSASVRSF